MTDTGLAIYSTCPQSKNYSSEGYLERVVEVSRWSDEFGYAGMLVYTDNGLVDPWLVSQVVLQNTQRLAPLVAIQPVYMHPYAAAKMVATLAFMHGRSLSLNMLAGGFKLDLEALGDDTPHDDRYVRTTEYTLILKELLQGRRPVTFDGRYYQVDKLKMTPALPEELWPQILISGSSEAGRKAARDIDATAIRYPEPPEDEMKATDGLQEGVRVGIVARANNDEAWRVALERFPEDRHGQITHQLAMKVSDSTWHKTLSETDDGSGSGRPTYWLGPFKNYRTFCPYLVGSYEETATQVARYIRLGFRTFILDIPPSLEELEHTRLVFDRAREIAGKG